MTQEVAIYQKNMICCHDFAPLQSLQVYVQLSVMYMSYIITQNHKKYFNDCVDKQQ